MELRAGRLMTNVSNESISHHPEANSPHAGETILSIHHHAARRKPRFRKVAAVVVLLLSLFALVASSQLVPSLLLLLFSSNLVVSSQVLPARAGHASIWASQPSSTSPSPSFDNPRNLKERWDREQLEGRSSLHTTYSSSATLPPSHKLSETSREFLVILQDGSLHRITSDGEVRWSKPGALFRPSPELSATPEANEEAPKSGPTRRLVPGSDGQIFYKGEDGILIVSLCMCNIVEDLLVFPISAFAD